MAFPLTVTSASSSQTTNSTSHTVVMPAGVSVNDLLITAIAFDARPIVSSTIPDNWIALAPTADGGDNVGLRVYYKRAAGTEGASQAIVTDVVQTSAHRTYRISGDAFSTAPVAAIFQGAAPGTSADPASLNPATWDVEDTLWLVVTANDNGTVTATGFPTNYTDTGTLGSGDAADGCSISWASRNNATASEDPSAFTLSGSEEFCTATIAIRPAPLVEFVTLGAKSAGGTATVSVAYPASVATNYMAIAGRSAWDNAVTTAAEAGWDSHTDLLGGLVGTNIADSHQTRVALDIRNLIGNESGSVTFDQGGTAGGCIGEMIMYKSYTGLWLTETASGDDNTHGANRAITASASISLAPNDVVVAVVATDTDTNLATFSAPAITAAGITFDTTTRRTTGAGVTTGNDGNIEIFDARVLSGTATAAPAVAFTTGTNQCGPAAFIRLRSDLPVIPDVVMAPRIVP